MNTILFGAVALGVAVLGLVVHTWHFVATRRISLAVLWVIAPLAGAMVAFVMTPPSLVTASLGGAALVLAFLTLAATIVLPVVTGGGEQPEKVESRDR